MPEPAITPAACVWPDCLTPAQKAELADEVTAAMLGEPTTPMPDQRAVCGCTETESDCHGGFDVCCDRAAAAERRAQAVAKTARAEIRRRRDAEDAIARVQEVAVELELFAEVALKVPDRELYAAIAKSLRGALTPPAPGDHGGEGQ